MSADDVSLIILAGAAVLIAGVAAVRLSTRVGMPSMLFFLLIGLLAGESGLGIQFSDGALAQSVGTLLLAVILTEGGFSTRWEEIRPVLPRATLLASVGVLVSVGVTTALVFVLLGVDLRTAVILGAVASSTDAAATFSILRRIPLKSRTALTLEAESGFNDPPVIILVTLVTSDAWYSASPAMALVTGVYQMVGGVAVGGLVARAGQWLLSRIALPSSGLYPVATLATAMVAFSTAGLLDASGLAAAYVAGLWLGNAPLPHRQTTRGMADTLAQLSQMGLFVMLGLLASPTRLPDAVVGALVVGAALTFVARPVSVAVCLTWFRVGWREQAFTSWAGFRGAVPIVLATIPMTVGLPSAERIFDIVFLLVVVFTLIQGPLLPVLARRAGVVDEGATRDVSFEHGPLEDMKASLLKVAIEPGSRLAGLHADELRLPARAVLAMVVRGDDVLVPTPQTRLREGDHLLVAVRDQEVAVTEERLRRLSRSGRLARWLE